MRGNNRRTIFASDADRRLFLTSLGTARGRCGWRIHMYCLMTNHFHLLVETPEPNIAIGMQWLNSRYAHCFNRTYERIGHLFQRRYADGLIQDDEHLRTVMRYIPLNPVKAKLCGRPEDWPWSSYQATLGLCAPPRFLTIDWLLAKFDPRQDEARERYRDWVEDGLATLRSNATMPSLGEIFGTARPISGDAIRRARSAGYTLQQIADHLGISVATTWRWAATKV
ncbi:MAG TPA: transposase [Gaiellales bacterium]|nr:transposase [Gaiellales bacterium]